MLQAIWQYFDGKSHIKFSTYGSVVLETAYREKKPFAEWSEKHGSYKASLKNWKVDYNGNSFSVRRFEPGTVVDFTLHMNCSSRKYVNVYITTLYYYEYKALRFKV